MERFAFAPAAAPFVMAFSDLNNLVLRRPGPDDSKSQILVTSSTTAALESILDAHALEDGSHFRLYLQDLVTLGFDKPLRLTDTLAFLWSDDLRAARRTCYVITALLASSTPALRLVVVEAIEATGAVAFPAFRALADELFEQQGLTLRYFGRRHEALETGHVIATPEISREILRIAFSEEEQGDARRRVDVVFTCFEDMMSEALAYSLCPRKIRL